jgi:uncharacterized membrane protein YsdA (DUF1294 family)
MGIIAYPLYGIAGIVAVGYVTVQAHDRLGLTWLLAYLVAINAVAFAFYAYDKIFVKLLKLLGLRVPEKVLIWELAFPGGIFGAFLAMQLFGHKVGPDSRDFRFELLKAFAIQVALLAALLFILVVQARR